MELSKTCTCCGETFPATTERFYKSKKGKYGLEAECKTCFRARQNTRQRTPEGKARAAEYKARPENKARRNKLKRERCKNDPDYRLTLNMRNRFYGWLTSKSADKKCSVFDLTGCTLSELWDHLESKFEDGMTRDNYGEWHVDHIIPLSKFDPNCWMQMSVAWDVDNLQPLWASDNCSKGAKLDWSKK